MGGLNRQCMADFAHKLQHKLHSNFEAFRVTVSVHKNPGVIHNKQSASKEEAAFHNEIIVPSNRSLSSELLMSRDDRKNQVIACVLRPQFRHKGIRVYLS